MRTVGYDVLKLSVRSIFRVKFGDSRFHFQCVQEAHIPVRDKLDQVWDQTRITELAKTPDQKNGEEFEDISSRAGFAIPPISATRDDGDRSSQFAIWGDR